MNPLAKGAIQCQRCKDVVTGYEHRVKFYFHCGERVMLGAYAVLSCGCEISDYELEVDYSAEPNEAKMVDTLRKTTVLEFADSGPLNAVWHDDLFEDDD